jgi:hypothetical protein
MLTFTLVCLVDLVALCHYVALKCTEHITPKFRQATAELVGNAVRLCQEQVMGCVKLLIQALVSKQSPELALDAAWALNEMVRGAARGCAGLLLSLPLWECQRRDVAICEVESGISSDSHRFTMIYNIDMFF